MTYNHREDEWQTSRWPADNFYQTMLNLYIFDA